MMNTSVLLKYLALLLFGLAGCVYLYGQYLSYNLESEILSFLQKQLQKKKDLNNMFFRDVSEVQSRRLFRWLKFLPGFHVPRAITTEPSVSYELPEDDFLAKLRQWLPIVWENSSLPRRIELVTREINNEVTRYHNCMFQVFEFNNQLLDSFFLGKEYHINPCNYGMCDPTISVGSDRMHTISAFNMAELYFKYLTYALICVVLIRQCGIIWDLVEQLNQCAKGKDSDDEDSDTEYTTDEDVNDISDDEQGGDESNAESKDSDDKDFDTV